VWLIHKKGGVTVASNFKVAIRRNSANLHVKLMGDFDGSSAHQLLNLLIKKGLAGSRVFIHTDSLKTIVPFGRDVFHGNLDLLRKKSLHLLFTGDRATELSP
jgi:hypothetical protein